MILNDTIEDGATNDLSIIANQLKTVLLEEFEIKVTKDTAEFVINHIYTGVHWIFNRASISTDYLGIYIQDYGETLASIIDVGNTQFLQINPKLFTQIEQISQAINDSGVLVGNLEITLESQFEGVPNIHCTLSDFLASIGLEEGTHYIQGLVARGHNIPGFERMENPTKISIESDQDPEQAMKMHIETRDHLDEQTKPHELNAKYWVNEYFKEKYMGKSPWGDFYLALKKIAERKAKKNKRFNLLKVFGIRT